MSQKVYHQRGDELAQMYSTAVGVETEILNGNLSSRNERLVNKNIYGSQDHISTTPFYLEDIPKRHLLRD